MPKKETYQIQIGPNEKPIFIGKKFTKKEGQDQLIEMSEKIISAKDNACIFPTTNQDGESCIVPGAIVMGAISSIRKTSDIEKDKKSNTNTK